jgi:hypothetical protein
MEIPRRFESVAGFTHDLRLAEEMPEAHAPWRYDPGLATGLKFPAPAKD